MFIHYQCLKSRWNFLQCCTSVDDETDGLWWHLDFVIVSVYLDLYRLRHTCKVSSFTCWSGNPLHFNDNLQRCQTCNTCGGTRMLLELCCSSYDSHYSRHYLCYPLIYHVETVLLDANSSQQRWTASVPLQDYLSFKEEAVLMYGMLREYVSSVTRTHRIRT